MYAKVENGKRKNNQSRRTRQKLRHKQKRCNLKVKLSDMQNECDRDYGKEKEENEESSIRKQNGTGP